MFVKNEKKIIIFNNNNNNLIYTYFLFLTLNCKNFKKRNELGSLVTVFSLINFYINFLTKKLKNQCKFSNGFAV